MYDKELALNNPNKNVASIGSGSLVSGLHGGRGDFGPRSNHLTIACRFVQRGRTSTINFRKSCFILLLKYVFSFWSPLSLFLAFFCPLVLFFVPEFGFGLLFSL